MWYNINMNKFYKYLLPVVLLIIALGISTFINNQFVLFLGWVISLIWLNRVALEFNNKFVKITTMVLIIGTIIWSILLLFSAQQWSIG